MSLSSVASIPVRWAGPVHIEYHTGERDKLLVPLATFETPLWPSVSRGALATSVQGIKTLLLGGQMTRSVIIRGRSSTRLYELVTFIQKNFTALQEVTQHTSAYCQLKDWYYEIHGSCLYARFSFETAQASGHNMTTKAAQGLLDHILSHHGDLEYGSISANACTDKKVSAINAYLGRGQHVIAETLVSKKLCTKILKTTPAKIVQLHIEKNYLGSIIAGSLRSANAHFANMLLAFYLAVGQDAANIVEGSQGISFAQQTAEGDLYFSVTLPHLIVGTYGNGKNLSWVCDNLRELGCLPEQHPHSSGRLAQIIAATVLCGELSLLAAQTTPGTLIESHLRLERAKVNV
jgi:hydroxymethylglutaryl-CoA reductase (NADPH)